ncbi:MAG: hypothetical protein ACI30R_04400 [Sodaliphilus sp.]
MMAILMLPLAMQAYTKGERYRAVPVNEYRNAMGKVVTYSVEYNKLTRGYDITVNNPFDHTIIVTLEGYSNLPNRYIDTYAFEVTAHKTKTNSAGDREEVRNVQYCFKKKYGTCDF